jgi:DNA-binding NarL/FixJ family response regulator
MLDDQLFENLITVGIWASDPLTHDAVATYLNSCRTVKLLPDQLTALADRVLILTTDVTEEILSRMAHESVETVNPNRRFILVANEISEIQVASAIKYGLVDVLPRQRVGLVQITKSLTASTGKQNDSTETLKKRILADVGLSDDRFEPFGAVNLSDFSQREIDILQLLSEGRNTVEIARTLGYSERTIKSVLHGAINRLGLHGRVHAVAHAMRSGMIQ